MLLTAVRVGAVLAWFAYGKLTLFGKTITESTPAPQEILVMRTRGGLLEVSRIRATETFDTTFVRSVLGFEVARTVARIRLPAVYRYHIELAPEWHVLRNGETFTVITPPVKPSLPVAVDLARMEKEVSGVWSFFTGTVDLNELEQSITARLARKSVLPAYIRLQREAARKTVGEFVRKWLVTQTQWTTESGSNIRVYFADEPIGSFGPQALPQLRPAGVKADGGS